MSNRQIIQATVKDGMTFSEVHPLVKFLSCDGCGCLFMPDCDGELVYPDRYEYVGDPEGVVREHHECVCHELPYTIPLDNPDESE